MLIKSVIFDAYGTLFDTGDGSVRATGDILQRNGVDLNPAEVYARWKQLHKQHIESLETFVKEEDIFLLDLKQLYLEYGVAGNPEEDVKLMLATLGVRCLYPEALEVVRIIREKYRVYIASTTDEEPLISDIKRNGLLVDGYFTSQSLKVYKPQKAFFEQVMARLGLTPEEMIYVGDSLRDDVYGPGQVNIKTVWVNRNDRPRVEGDSIPDYQIQNLSELSLLLDKISVGRESSP